MRQPCGGDKARATNARAAARATRIDRIRARRLPRTTRRRSRARNAGPRRRPGVGIAALVWWARQQKKDSELDDEADAPPPPRTEEAPKDAASGEAVKAEFNACKQKAFELFKASPPRYAEAAEWFSKAIDLSIAHETLAPQRKALYNSPRVASGVMIWRPHSRTVPSC